MITDHVDDFTFDFSDEGDGPNNGDGELRKLLLDMAEDTDRRLVKLSETIDPAIRGIKPERVSRFAPQGGLMPFNPTDMGNAKRFAALYRGKVRYCHTWKKWLIYSGGRWAKDETGEIIRLAKSTVESIYGEARMIPEEVERKAVAKHAIHSESDKRIQSMIRLAESEEGIPVLPSELDRDVHKLNCLNGTIDLRQAKLLPHNPADLITRQAPVSYDEEAVAPRWKQFLNEIFMNRPDLTDFMHRYLGYCCTGETREQVFVIGYGGGANGKSTLLDTVLEVLGDYATSTPFSTFTLRRRESVRNDLADISSARLVTASEAGEGMPFDEELVKRLTGDGSMKARFLFSEFFSFAPRFKLFLATNHKPRIKGTDLAIWRRVRLVPFEAVYEGENRDQKLKEKLLAEAPGILTWLVIGAMLWQDMGLGNPEEVREATEQYRAGEDTLGCFLNECCEKGDGLRQPARVLYHAYRDYSGGRAISEKAFAEKMEQRGFEKKKTSTGAFYLGISLLPGIRDDG